MNTQRGERERGGGEEPRGTELPFKCKAWIPPGPAGGRVHASPEHCGMLAVPGEPQRLTPAPSGPVSFPQAR